MWFFWPGVSQLKYTQVVSVYVNMVQYNSVIAYFVQQVAPSAKL